VLAASSLMFHPPVHCRDAQYLRLVAEHSISGWSPIAHHPVNPHGDRDWDDIAEHPLEHGWAIAVSPRRSSWCKWFEALGGAGVWGRSRGTKWSNGGESQISHNLLRKVDLIQPLSRRALPNKSLERSGQVSSRGRSASSSPLNLVVRPTLNFEFSSTDLYLGAENCDV
jgi:hypothetical protein